MLYYAMLSPLHLVFIDTQTVRQFLFIIFAHHHIVKRTARLQLSYACHNCMKHCGSIWRHVVCLVLLNMHLLGTRVFILSFLAILFHSFAASSVSVRRQFMMT